MMLTVLKSLVFLLINFAGIKNGVEQYTKNLYNHSTLFHVKTDLNSLNKCIEDDILTVLPNDNNCCLNSATIFLHNEVEQCSFLDARFEEFTLFCIIYVSSRILKKHNTTIKFFGSLRIGKGYNYHHFIARIETCHNSSKRLKQKTCGKISFKEQKQH